MKVSGLQLLGPASEETRDSAWIIPSEVTADHLKDTLHYINQAEFSPPTFEDGSSAESQMKRKTVPRQKAAFDDEDEDDNDIGADFLDDEQLFPAGGPTARKAIDAPSSKSKKKSTKRQRRAENGESADVDDERARKRRERELEKARKIKSALYVRDGDDDFDSDEDEAFFARERAIAARAENAAKSAAGTTEMATQGAPRKKRKSEVLLEDTDDDDEDGEEADDLDFSRRALSSQDGAASETDDTPVDGSDSETSKKRRLSVEDEDDVDSSGEDEEMLGTGKMASTTGPDEEAEDDEVHMPLRRPRVRGGFVIDSDDDE